MSHESRVALERIVALCEKSENLSRRQVRMFDIALEGLGYLRCQRAGIIEKWQQPLIQKIRDRIERRDARMVAPP